MQALSIIQRGRLQWYISANNPQNSNYDVNIIEAGVLFHVFVKIYSYLSMKLLFLTHIETVYALFSSIIF